MTVRAGIYCRISRDRTGEQLGVKRQEKLCRELAASKGWEIVDVYVDNDISASTRKRRPDYERLMADVEAGRITGIVSYHPDRLHRRPIELEGFIDIVDQAGAEVLTARAGEYDLSTPTGRMVARIVGAVARAEAERIAEKTRDKKRELAERGLPAGGGRRRFGYARGGPAGLTVIEEEAAIVRRAAAEVLGGWSLRSVVARLNELDVLPDAGHWTSPSLRSVLISPTTAGLRTYHGEVVGKAAWEPILDEATWSRLVKLADSRRRGNFRRSDILLAGVLTCGRCGHRMYRMGASAKPHYQCPKRTGGCDRNAIGAWRIDPHVIDEVDGWFDDPRMAAAIQAYAAGEAEAHVDDIDDEMAQLEAELAALTRQRLTGELLEVEWREARAFGAERLTELRRERSRRVRAARPAVLERVDYVAEWKSADPGRRNRVLRQILREIVLEPAGENRHRPVDDRVRIYGAWAED